jgi:hypothetical protein
VLPSSQYCAASASGSVVPERSLRLAVSLLLRVRGGAPRPAGPGSVGLPAGMPLHARSMSVRPTLTANHWMLRCDASLLIRLHADRDCHQQLHAADERTTQSTKVRYAGRVPILALAIITAYGSM